MTAPKDLARLAKFKEDCRFRMLGKVPANKGKPGKNKGQKPWNKSLTYEQKKKRSAEVAIAHGKARRGKYIWITNGVAELQILYIHAIPIGWNRGKLKGRIPANKGIPLSEERLEAARTASRKAADITRGIPRTPEDRKKVSNGNKEAWKRIKIEGRAEEITRKAAKTHLGQKHRQKTQEERQRLSEIALAQISSGKRNPHENYKQIKKAIQSVKGGKIICQSSWEEKFARSLDSNSRVISFSKDKIRIPYIFNAKQRIYIVDFYILYASGSRELVEIKPSIFLDQNENPAKFEAARKWCAERNIDFVVLTEKEFKLFNEL